MAMSVEKGATALLLIVAIGVALTILTGVNYTNYANTKAQMVTANVPAAIQANFTTNGGAITNTGGSNANYVYYILFMALVIAVVIGALVGSVKSKGK